MKKKAHKKTHHKAQSHRKSKQPLYWYYVPFVAIVVGGVTLLAVLNTVFASLGK